ncbi:porin family protein [Pedobacter sp. MW01-1-1]|uniref:porin family protein n=1 Tax=Pedobacter sp. MW01-1-1 TaxID=3383027 RepID=UPI003FF0551D
MKKLFLSSLLLLIVIGGVMAQNSSEKLSFGVKAGINLANVNTDMYLLGADAVYEKITDYNFAALVNYKKAKNFSIQTGLSFQTKGYQLKFEEADYYKNKISVLEIPVNAVFDIPAGLGAIQINAGPYIGFNLKGKTIYDLGYVSSTPSLIAENRDLSFGNTANDDYNVLDYGFNVGLGYRFKDFATIGTNYGLGLANLVPEEKSSTAKVNFRVWSFSVGYWF